MGLVLCRCGAAAAKKCAECGCALNASGQCSKHPALNVETIRCLHCEKPLCFWHYVLQPGPHYPAALGQVCFPSCTHAFKGPEQRPIAIMVAR